MLSRQEARLKLLISNKCFFLGALAVQVQLIIIPLAMHLYFAYKILPCMSKITHYFHVNGCTE